jgi:uncharacterized membrane protein
MSVKSIAWFVMMLLAAAVAAYALIVSLDPDSRPELVTALFERQPTAAPAHFLGGAIALLLGALQFNTRLRVSFSGVHRWLGRIYVFAVIVGGIASLTMAPHALTGPVAVAGFGGLAIGWLVTTLNAYRHIRQKNIVAHRQWMIRSYALTLAAVTLRIYLPLSQIADISFMIAYPIIAWISWVPNVVIAEWMVRAKPKT